jgi:hypothetical protein
VTAAVPTITWPEPEPVVYGTALSSNQLNPTASVGNPAASVGGSFVFTPTNGSVLTAGTNTLSAVFRPCGLQQRN